MQHSLASHSSFFSYYTLSSLFNDFDIFLVLHLERKKCTCPLVVRMKTRRLLLMSNFRPQIVYITYEGLLVISQKLFRVTGWPFSQLMKSIQKATQNAPEIYGHVQLPATSGLPGPPLSGEIYWPTAPRPSLLTCITIFDPPFTCKLCRPCYLRLRIFDDITECYAGRKSGN